MSSKFREIRDELSLVLAARGTLLDALFLPLLFLLLNSLLPFNAAVSLSLAEALLLAFFRRRQGRPLRAALSGLGSLLAAVVLVRVIGRSSGIVIPGIVTGALTTLACLISVLARRPLVAWTSHFARRWPLAWYWHPRVRPAYTEVTLVWTLFFAVRLALQIALLSQQDVALLAAIQFASGWPATLTLLIASYLFGTWRLKQLQGPGVEEFKRGTPPPWSGQRRGF